MLIVIVCLIVKCRAFYGDFACLQKDCFHLGPFKVINTFAVTCNIHLGTNWQISLSETFNIDMVIFPENSSGCIGPDDKPTLAIPSKT